MKLSDVMSAMHLQIYAEVALLIFVAVFLLVLLQVSFGKNESAWQKARLLPLEETPASPRPPQAGSAQS
ncbi:MAG TPA: hypothetical protein VI072_17130 [Polyangiaceae bacterium]